ncbi:MAG: hypothetical protein GWN62_10595, partial [Aliifodinibius sp.]|nr:hypothetical protein [Fodinibius sp.]
MTNNEMSTTSPQPTETVAPTDDNTQSEEQPDQGEEGMELDQSQAVSTGEEDAESTSTTRQQNGYGLMGEPNQAITNGYTIVVHSLRDQQQAEQNRQQLQEAGYRALISQAQVE